MIKRYGFQNFWLFIKYFRKLEICIVFLKNKYKYFAIDFML